MAAKRPRMRRGNSARPLLAAARPTIGVEVNDRKSVVSQKLLADVGSAVGRVGRIERDRAVVVDEADEARVLHAGRLGAHRRPQHPFGKRYVVGEFDGIGPLGDGPDQRNRLARACPRVLRWVWSCVELFVEVGSGEPLTERIEDVVGGLAARRRAARARCGTRLRPAAWA